MMKRILACALCLMVLLSILPTAAADETVRVEQLDFSMQLPAGYRCLHIETPAADSQWNTFDRADFLADYDDLGLFLFARSHSDISVFGSTGACNLPDFDLMTEDAILQEFAWFYSLENDTLLSQPEIYRTDHSIFFTYVYAWENTDGSKSYSRTYATVRNGKYYIFNTAEDAPLTEAQETTVRNIIDTVVIDRKPFEPTSVHGTTHKQAGIFLNVPVAYSFKNPELPEGDACWLTWDKDDFLQWIDGTDICLYADDTYSTLTVFAEHLGNDDDWLGHTNDQVLYESRDALREYINEELFSPVQVCTFRTLPYVTAMGLNDGVLFRVYTTVHNGTRYTFRFYSDKPFSWALDEEFRSILESVQYTEPADPPAPEHITSLADELTTDPGTGVSFLLPDRWQYFGAEQVQSAFSFSLGPQRNYSSDYTDESVSIYCNRFPQRDLHYLDGVTDPKEIAAELITRYHEETITPDMLELRNFKGNAYYVYRPTKLGVMDFTDLMVHVRDDQVYLFATDAPLDSPMHKDFMAMMGTVEFGPFATTVEINEAEPVEAPAELPEIDTSGLRTIMLWAVGILLAVLVGVVLFLLLVIRKPKPKPEPTGHFCPYCGKALEDDTQFCPYCGKQL